MKWRFDKKSFVISLIIFFVEVLIAKFVDDAFIRPYGGDILVVILIYYFVRSFIRVEPLYLAIGVVLFAYMIEIGQYFGLVEILGMQDNRFMRTIIGTSFSWGDIVCYTIGGFICYLINRKEKI
ncbi:DUF2809 domain-containing protein [Dysgonomonas sp. 521]|uniref:ribosomal maturation YjgA family protein n=1 Tax=Dysgonomonas sp. 521 TaxID=2302932 RepID=UPI0013D63609|nr:DUF2809 domain-containing protein [Dysgonomonas sp. 521]NDV94162.1 DUF2809 domain-containing protein [Dysgonomonas sp. 521]